MSNDRTQDEADLHKLLESPGMRHALSRTFARYPEDKQFDDKRKYPRGRAKAVAEACLQAIKGTK